mgnify:FL=1
MTFSLGNKNLKSYWIHTFNLWRYKSVWWNSEIKSILRSLYGVEIQLPCISFTTISHVSKKSIACIPPQENKIEMGCLLQRLSKSWYNLWSWGYICLPRINVIIILIILNNTCSLLHWALPAFIILTLHGWVK